MILEREIQRWDCFSKALRDEDKAIFKELEIHTSLSSTYTSWRYAISMIRNSKIKLSKIVSHKFPLSKFREALDLAIDRKGLKIVLIPDEEWKIEN